MGNQEAQPGPYKRTYTKTIKVAPVEFTITENDESTHVPSAECDCDGGTPPGLLEAIMTMLQNLGKTPPPTAAEPPPDSTATEDVT